MKTTKGKSRKRANGQTHPGESPLRQATQKVEDAAPEIVDAIIERAKKGSYLHAKFVFDFAGISAPAPVPEPEKESLAALLLRELQLLTVQPPDDSQAGAAQQTGSEAVLR